ncbi:MAG: hypothetical protein AAGJ18_29895, partial [Bacteroidota bacterium]
MESKKHNVEDQAIKSIKRRTTKRAKTVAKKPPKKKKPTRNFPIITLVESLKIANKIKELNGGNPWAPKEVS